MPVGAIVAGFIKQVVVDKVIDKVADKGKEGAHNRIDGVVEKFLPIG